MKITGYPTDLTCVKTPQLYVESLLNHIKELSEGVQFLADNLVGSIPVEACQSVKGYSSSGIFGEISDNCDTATGLVIEAKSNVSRIRNAIGK